jgi:competence protein ComGC
MKCIILKEMSCCEFRSLELRIGEMKCIKNKMKNKKGQFGIISLLLVLAIIIGILLIIGMIYGIHWETTRNGTHTGTVTAVEENGMIWHTYSVYFKTDAQSSQEDLYCVKDSNLLETLREKEMNKDKVTITYNGYFLNGISNCEIGAVGIITGVR